MAPDGMVVAIWPSVMNPAVRLVLFGIAFTLAGICALVLQLKDSQIPRRRSVALERVEFLRVSRRTSRNTRRQARLLSDVPSHLGGEPRQARPFKQR
jgi:hypothetical protein